jgi:tubulin polyglutamylase TTLL6/13
MKLGMMDVGEDDSWNLYWTDVSISIEKVKEMKRFQVTNDIFWYDCCLVLHIIVR